MAVRYNQLEIARFILEQEITPCKWTLKTAVKYNYLEMAKLLLDHGIDEGIEEAFNYAKENKYRAMVHLLEYREL